MSSELKDLAEPGARELLRCAEPLRLAYLGIDGLPRVIPIGFLWKDERLFVCTATSAPKVAALRKCPNVAVTIDTGNTSATAKQLLIRGVAAIEIVEGVAPEYLEAAAKTLGDADLEEFEAQVQTVFERQARISIVPEWARFYDFGAGRLPPFLRGLVEDGQDRTGTA